MLVKLPLKVPLEPLILSIHRVVESQRHEILGQIPHSLHSSRQLLSNLASLCFLLPIRLTQSTENIYIKTRNFLQLSTLHIKSEVRDERPEHTPQHPNCIEQSSVEASILFSAACQVFLQSTVSTSLIAMEPFKTLRIQCCGKKTILASKSTAVPLLGSTAPKVQASRWFPRITYLKRNTNPFRCKSLISLFATSFLWLELRMYLSGSSSPSITPKTFSI